MHEIVECFYGSWKDSIRSFKLVHKNVKCCYVISLKGVGPGVVLVMGVCSPEEKDNV